MLAILHDTPLAIPVVDASDGRLVQIMDSIARDTKLNKYELVMTTIATGILIWTFFIQKVRYY